MAARVAVGSRGKDSNPIICQTERADEEGDAECSRVFIAFVLQAGARRQALHGEWSRARRVNYLVRLLSVH